MIERLRGSNTPEQQKYLYSKTFDHTKWDDHVLRVKYTADVLRNISPKVASIADLSCGDAAIIEAADMMDRAWLGDLTPGWDFCGPIEETIHLIPNIDMFLLSETLEHVEDPIGVLCSIKGKADRLLLSTPCGETGNGNPEHYWGWDTDGVRLLLRGAGWSNLKFELYKPSFSSCYTFQIWECS